jgi:iron complex outermembrane receptor protein
MEITLNIFVKNNLLLILVGNTLLLQTSASQSAEPAVNELGNIIIVTADFEDSNVLELPTSVTVISEDDAEERNAQHLSDLLNLAPNVNFATGASRGKFIQIRGIGERSEFQEPVNYSVGLVMDGIDLTGIGLAATTLDIQQTEILRGPQGTLYGANGLAGLINMVSNSPTENFIGRVGLTLEDYAGRGYSAMLSGAISENSGLRFAVQNYKSDGFIKNTFLNRKDTNNIDETNARLKYRYQPSDDLSLAATIFYADVNNGYDAFSLDNNQTTLSDEPGSDRQNTLAGALSVKWKLSETLNFESTLSAADSDLSYSYDEDWSNIGICDGLACNSQDAGFDWWYKWQDQYDRSNKNINLDIRLLSESKYNNWVLGVYLKEQMVDLSRQHTPDPLFTSEFDTTNKSLYGQYSFSLSDNVKLTSGLRFENRTAIYNDNNNIQFSPNEDMWGGKVSIDYRLEKNKLLYATISRGYKAGGFNANNDLPIVEQEFETETQWNYEAGLKGLWLDNKLTMQVALFYQDRKNIQTKQSLVSSIATGLPLSDISSCPCSFTDFTDNAAEGINYGLEFQAQLRANDWLVFYSNLGLLHTEYKKFESFNHIDADLNSIPPVPYNLNGRAQAHSPEHQIAIGSRLFISDELSLNLEIESKGEFYFSDRHEEKSDSYELLNLRMTYRLDNWKLHLYAHNLTDEKTQTRGFGSFGNDPRDFYTTKPYYQFGNPRVIGLSANINF